MLIPHFSNFSFLLLITYLHQDILAEAGKGIFEAIKTDVMRLPYSAAHTVAHLFCAVPFPVLTHAANERACYTGKLQVFSFNIISANNYFTRCCSRWRWSVLLHMVCCYDNKGTFPVQCSLCVDVPEIILLINHPVLFQRLLLLYYRQPACRKYTKPTVPGGHRQLGMQARLTQGRSRFWQVLAHSRPVSPVLQPARMSGGLHRADLRSADKNKFA